MAEASTSKRQNVIDVVIAVVLALVVFLTASEVSRIYRLVTLHTVPSESFFEPLQLDVPNFSVGDRPVILYDRIIHREFTADWVVEVQQVQENGSVLAVCSGSGHTIYQPEKGLPSTGVTLDWFLGRPCDLDEGTYRVVANWVIERPEAVGNVSARLLSNVFQVD